jgi:hypothetical protein
MRGDASIWVEKEMRRIALATAATLAILAGGLFVPNRAEAMTITTPAGILAALDGTNLAQDVAYICRRVWRCGPYGCGWRRGCWWAGAAPYSYGGPYRRRYWW